MLDNFEQYWTGNSRRVDDAQELLGVGQLNEPRNQSKQTNADNLIVDFSKQAHSPTAQPVDDNDQYTKQTRLNYEALPWYKVETDVDTTQMLSPSLQKTNSLLKNFSWDVKCARASLLNCNRALPQFPQSEWLSILNGNAIDLDHVLSNIYMTFQNKQESIKLGEKH